MDYIVEDGIDFYKLLASNDIDLSDNNKCLITHEPLEKNHITLICNHSFNYDALYNEVLKQKTKINTLEITELKLDEIKCPYCRNIQKGLLPKLSHVQSVYGVTRPKKFCMQCYKCSWVYKTGKNIGKTCESIATHLGEAPFCNKHFTSVNNTTLNGNQDLFKKYKVKDLKQILLTNKLKVSGNKSMLIERIISNGIEFKNI
tara:strand:+ start:19080 stop:19685 length:606 start_codon:yes stop_codon:yes gene_type:complete